MWLQRRVAVVIPAFNEARLIGPTILGLPDWIDDVIVVDDASGDRTAESARASQRSGVRVLVHEKNGGVGAATVTGYREALALGADWIVVVNGDAQMNPDDIPGLLAALDAGADVVRGNRFARTQTLACMPVQRRLAVVVLSAFTRLATGVSSLHDSQSGFHALSRRALQRLPLATLWPRYGFPNDLVARAAEAGLRVAEVGVDAVYGDEESGLRTWHVLHPVGTVILKAALRRGLRWASALHRGDRAPRTAAAEAELQAVAPVTSTTARPANVSEPRRRSAAGGR